MRTPEDSDPGEFCIRVQTGPLAGAVFALEDKLDIGRSSGCDIHLITHGTSRAHASVVRKGDNVVLVDLMSSNGTWLGNQRVQQCSLSVGARFRIAESEFLLDAFKPGDSLGCVPMDQVIDARVTNPTQPFGLTLNLERAAGAESPVLPQETSVPDGELIQEIILYRALRLMMTRGQRLERDAHKRFVDLSRALCKAEGSAPIPERFSVSARGSLSFEDDRDVDHPGVVREIAIDGAVVQAPDRPTTNDLLCWLSLPLVGPRSVRTFVLTARIAWVRDEEIGLVFSGAPTWARNTEGAGDDSGEPPSDEATQPIELREWPSSNRGGGRSA